MTIIISGPNAVRSQPRVRLNLPQHRGHLPCRLPGANVIKLFTAVNYEFS
jgi:hypothetical protein